MGALRTALRHHPALPLMRAGFTLIEVLVTITIIAVLATLLTPRFSDDDRLRLMAASNLLISDIEYAQVMSITHPGDPVVVSFDPGSATYWLAYEYAPSDPLIREDSGEAYLVTFGQGRASSAAGVALAVSGVTGNILEFDAMGALKDLGAAPLFTLTRGDEWIQVQITSTGTLNESFGTGTPP